ncbi:ATP-binding protein [uncultured Tateyamaria sp.]|uniref:ATP-binding protein n=1 Tax=uncultured Tateyamaria sp. TaxID=455651 RepID=UPI002636687C|nr:ATP-binding protein [uncultured Tateyamaria sp.]
MTVTMQTTPEMELALLREGLEATIGSVRARLSALAEGTALPPFVASKESALLRLSSIFRLTEVEQELLLLAVAMELDGATAAAVQALGGREVCDVSVAERLVGPAIWDALVPEAPLRRWRLLELGGAGPLWQRSLRADERIVHALLGTMYLDQRLEGMVRPVWADGVVSARERDLAERLTQAWRGVARPPVILLGGRDAAAKRALAAEAAARLGMGLYRVAAVDIPGDWVQRYALAIFLDRELALSSAAVLIEGAAGAFADLISGPTILAADDPDLPERQPVLRLDLAEADRRERRDLWQQALGTQGEAALLDRVAAQFALPPSAIRAAAAEMEPGMEPEALTGRLWQAARLQGRRALDGLADRIESRAGWGDLVLPEDQLSVLKDLAGHLRDAWVVNQEWGWEGKSPRGLGAAALFAGPSGTGKTLAAEVLAGELALDLYRIDLSQVVSKYIGETEKNLSRIFEAAEDGGAILLFDEADALFGKRSEVKDSHDRYANVEVSYLLQRMEAYSGLAILTTNQKGAVDKAFLRRLRYVLNFPFPDAAARAEIWARIFPDETPLEGVRPDALAALNIAGGAIRSIALNAAYLAAGVGEPVRMGHVLLAARREYTKLEKPFTSAEMGAFR